MVIIKKQKENTYSKYYGVCWDKNEGKFEAYIYINGIKKHLGYYDNEIHAAYAHDVALKYLLEKEAI